MPAAIAAAVFLAVGPREASGSDFHVDFDDSGADLVTRLFEKGRPDPRLARKVRETPGYRLLFDQVALQSKPRRTSADVAGEFAEVLASATAGREASYGLARVRAHPAQYREAIREFRRVSRHVQWGIASRVNELLPPGSDVRSTAHLIVGGTASGFAFSDRDDIAIRLDDFVTLNPREPVDIGRLASVLCHELYHVGFRAAGGQPPRPDRPDRHWIQLARAYGPDLVGEVWRASGTERWNGPAMRTRLEAWKPSLHRDPHSLDRLLGALSRLQNEGSAVYAEEPIAETVSAGANRATPLEARRSDFELLAEVLRAFATGGAPHEIERLAERGFGAGSPFYRVGAHVARRIDTRSGRRPYLATVRDGPLAFFEAYFRTHPYGPGEIDSASRETIREVIEEVREVASRR